MAATVSRPSGGNAACRDTNRTACLRLQNVIGVCGEMSRMFIAAMPPQASDVPDARREPSAAPARRRVRFQQVTPIGRNFQGELIKPRPVVADKEPSAANTATAGRGFMA